MTYMSNQTQQYNVDLSAFLVPRQHLFMQYPA